MLDALRRFPGFRIFRRQSELTAQGSATKPAGADVGARLRDASGTPVAELLAQLGPTPRGRTNAEAEERLEKYGPNRVASERPPRWYVQLGHSFTNPFVLLLLVLAAVSLIAGDIQATIIISTMVIIGVALRFYQELRSTVAAEKLRAMVKVTATVIRRALDNVSYASEVPIERVLPGGLVQHPARATIAP